MSSITVTPYTDAAPCPRTEVRVDGLDASVASLTLTRTAEGRTVRVRGAINVPVAGGYSTLDPEVGFQVPSTYRAELFAADGSSLGFTPTGTATVDVSDCWVHNPLDPSTSTSISVDDTSGKSLTRSTPAERYYPEGRTLAVFVSRRRLGLQGVDLYFSTDDAVVAQKFELMIGDYNAPTTPILCVRTPPFLDIPRTFYAAVLDPKLKPINVHMGGTLREWSVNADEAAPPAPGIIMPILSRDDIDAAFATRDAMDAAYATRLDRDRDYSKAGLA